MTTDMNLGLLLPTVGGFNKLAVRRIALPLTAMQ